jgi:hypothetical protein
MLEIKLLPAEVDIAEESHPKFPLEAWMKPRLLLLPLVGMTLAGQGAPALKWRGALWASGTASDRQTADGSSFLNTVGAGEGKLALDGLQVGGDINLAEGWSVKFTILAGRTEKVLNDADLESGSVAYPEAMLVWTGAKDTLKVGRMWTAMGMEVMDQTADLTASRGLLFTYAIPYNQVGLAWRHAFSPSWSTDVWLYNGEDRVNDNNRAKTLGAGINYNHGGAAEKFISVMTFSGAEQDGFGDSAATGAEGRKRTRLCSTFGWAWGPSTLLGEVETAQETFAVGAIEGASGETKAKWSGFGLTYKYALNDRWAWFARAESMKDDLGVRLNYDSTVAADWAARQDADLRATSFTLGVERKWGATFSRFELRRDSLNKDVHEKRNVDELNGKAFRSGTSATWSFGTSF